MNENPKHEELTEEEFLELVLEEQEKALAQAREQRLNSTYKKPKRQKPIVRIIVWLIALSLVFNTFAVIFNMYSIPAIEFLRVSSHLSGQDTIQTYKKAVVTINTQDSKGTGFAISSDGYILTNEHVIDDALTISVTFPDGQIYEADVLEAYEQFDLALLKIDGTELPYLTLAKSSQFKAEEHVYFIGNPLYFSGIANEGTLLGNTSASSIDTEIMMMDAPVYKGNSGSPVINETGEVIGVVFATGKREPYGKVGLFIPVEAVHENFSTFLP
ncbi:MAG: serine protease [Solibacillus sp.]